MILLVRAATLPGYVDGVMFYLTPQWDKLADINVSTTLQSGRWKELGGCSVVDVTEWVRMLTMSGSL